MLETVCNLNARAESERVAAVDLELGLGVDALTFPKFREKANNDSQWER